MIRARLQFSKIWSRADRVDRIFWTTWTFGVVWSPRNRVVKFVAGPLNMTFSPSEAWSNRREYLELTGQRPVDERAQAERERV